MDAKYRPSPTLDGGRLVIHKGIRYSVAATVEPDIWQWQFQIGENIRTGKTNTRLAALAARRVQMKIDAALRVSRVSSAIQSDNRAGAP
jgi:hypothetical protein